MKKKINILELCMRDGMRALRHKFTADEMAEVCKELNTVGVDSIEFGNGNGLGAVRSSTASLRAPIWNTSGPSVAWSPARL